MTYPTLTQIDVPDGQVAPHWPHSLLVDPVDGQVVSLDHEHPPLVLPAAEEGELAEVVAGVLSENCVLSLSGSEVIFRWYLARLSFRRMD